MIRIYFGGLRRADAPNPPYKKGTTLPFKIIREFIKLESASGIILFSVAILALIIDNSPLSYAYENIFHSQLGFHFGLWNLSLPLTEWINQGLMTFFFLLVGLEIKREILTGELNSWNTISLPIIAAIGGMLVPAAIYIYCNYHNPILLRGWAIPTATDIAFALAMLNLLGRKIPVSLKIFLTALAIFDDIGAIIIIAIFYTAHISFLFIILTLLAILMLFYFNRLAIKKLWPYLIVGFLLWFLMLQSGIHAVIAGVILAILIPLQGKENHPSPLQTLEHRLHPWVAFFILPLFGFANAGIAFTQINNSRWLNSLSMGIFLGLLIGKQVGVFSATWLAIKTKLAPMPKDANWVSLYGVSLICGIGFTMSLFIGNLAFNSSNANITSVRIGVLAGSLLSGLLGYWILHWIHRHRS